MQITTREQLQKLVETGTTIYSVHGLGSASYMAEHDTVGTEIVDHTFSSGEVSPFLDKKNRRLFDSPVFSLHDFNVDGGGYNAHKIFDNQDEAKEYFEWVIVNTNNPLYAFDLFDYFDHDYPEYDDMNDGYDD